MAHEIIQSAKGLVIGPFVLTETGITVKGKPTSEDYFEVGDFVRKTFDSGGWWMADWLRIGEEHPEWREEIDAVIGADEIADSTRRDYLNLAKKFPPGKRVVGGGVTITHHQAVQGLHEDDRDKLLERARDERLSRQDVRREARVVKRRTVSSGQAELAGKFRVLYVDCPWTYNSSSGADSGAFRTAQDHYPGMTVEQLMKMPVEAHVHKNAVMFFWVTAPMIYYATDVEKGPDPFRVIHAWGFEPKTGVVWDKVSHNFGHYTSIRHEHLIICTRGSLTPDRPTPMPDSVQTIRRSDEHSEKPEEFRQLIMQLYDGPYLELFARKRVQGWSAWGNQVGVL